MVVGPSLGHSTPAGADKTPVKWSLQQLVPSALDWFNPVWVTDLHGVELLRSRLTTALLLMAGVVMTSLGIASLGFSSDMPPLPHELHEAHFKLSHGALMATTLIAQAIGLFTSPMHSRIGLCLTMLSASLPSVWSGGSVGVVRILQGPQRALTSLMFFLLPLWAALMLWLVLVADVMVRYWALPSCSIETKLSVHHWLADMIGLCAIAVVQAYQGGIVLQAEDLARRTLKEALDQAEQLRREKELFVSQTSHEVRTPLNAITGLVDILCANVDAPKPFLDFSKSRRYLHMVRHSCSLLLTLVSDILDFFKLSANRLVVRPRGIVLYDVLSSCIQMMQVAADARHQYLGLYVDARVPGRVRADPVRLTQVVTNLLSNAIKYTPEHCAILLTVSRTDVPVQERREVEPDAAVGLLIEVTDAGPEAIPREKWSSIFEPFVQSADEVQERDTVVEGTGLGLTLVRMLCTAMGGGVTCESSPHCTSFTATVWVTDNQGADCSSPSLLVESSRHLQHLLWMVDMAPRPAWIHAALESVRVRHSPIVLPRLKLNIEEFMHECTCSDSERPCVVRDVVALALAAPEVDVRLWCLQEDVVQGDTIPPCLASLWLRRDQRAAVRFSPATLTRSGSLGNMHSQTPSSSLLSRTRLSVNSDLAGDSSSSDSRSALADHVLVAEDNSFNAEVLISLLGHLGFDVTSQVSLVSNGRAAASFVDGYCLGGKEEEEEEEKRVTEDDKHDQASAMLVAAWQAGQDAVSAGDGMGTLLVLMDYNMPIQNGLVASAQIHRRHGRSGRVQVCMVSASVLPVSGAQTPYAAVLPKPVTLDALSAALRSIQWPHITRG